VKDSELVDDWEGKEHAQSVLDRTNPSLTNVPKRIVRGWKHKADKQNYLSWARKQRQERKNADAFMSEAMENAVVDTEDELHHTRHGSTLKERENLLSANIDKAAKQQEQEQQRLFGGN
jgi:hypothetical protein